MREGKKLVIWLKDQQKHVSEMNCLKCNKLADKVWECPDIEVNFRLQHFQRHLDSAHLLHIVTLESDESDKLQSTLDPDNKCGLCDHIRFYKKYTAKYGDAYCPTVGITKESQLSQVTNCDQFQRIRDRSGKPVLKYS